MRPMRLVFVLLITLVLVSNLPLAGITTKTSSAQTTPTPSFETADCQFDAPASREVTCGYLTVPKDRRHPNEETLRLHVAIFKAEADTPQPDPIVYLEGGPGGNALTQMETLFDFYFSPFAENRDFIVFDQRGTGYSEPALDCPESTEVVFDTLDQQLSIDESVELQLGAIAACHKRLATENISFGVFNSEENAADLADLRVALGIDEWNLYGISYGTRLALTAMRDQPDGIRSVILDSSYPLEVDLFATAAQNFDRSLQVLFSECTADAACNANYPDLENVLFDAVRQLNISPVTLPFVRASTGEDYNLLIDGNLVMDFMFQALYQSAWLPTLPKLIYSISEGDYGLLGVLYMAIADASDIVSYGMNLSVQCSEEVPFTSPVQQLPEHLLRLQEYLNGQINVGQNMVRACAIWLPDATPDPIENQPVYSDIPTLVMSGELDPITPPEWGQMVASELGNSQFFEFPGMGHGASIDGECATDIALAFLDDPTSPTDGSCIADLTGIAFVVPEDISLVPYEEPIFGIQGVVPEGWVQLAPGTYARSEMGDVAISQFAIPGTRLEIALNLVLGQFDLDSESDPVDNIATGNLDWSVYRFTIQGLEVYLAGAEDSGGAYMVMLQAPSSEIDPLYNSLLIPAVNAFAPLND